jgi:glycosyltransferase involved in cell wall biosynthesis
MLRIAYLLESTELSGGAQVALIQADALARRGHRVTVVSPQGEPRWLRLSRARFERASFRESQALGEAQVRVATFWTTVAPALEGARGPVFHLCQGYEGSFAIYAGQRSAIEAAYASPTYKLAISATLAARLTSLGWGPVQNVGQVFEVGDFRSGREREIAKPPEIIVVGPYDTDIKGVDVALEGLKIVKERGGAFRLRRISTTPAHEVEKRSGLVDEYHWHLPRERMPFAYRSADVFIGPSRSKEGFGLPVLEALATGLPCLLSETPTHREIAGDAAWYFPDGEPQGLAESLPHLLTETARARARVEGPRVASRFDPAAVAERLEKAFLDGLGGGEARRVSGG